MGGKLVLSSYGGFFTDASATIYTAILDIMIFQ